MGATRTYSLRTDGSKMIRNGGGFILRIAEDLDYTPPLCLDIMLDTQHRVQVEMLGTFTTVPAMYGQQTLIVSGMTPELTIDISLKPHINLTGEILKCPPSP